LYKPETVLGIIKSCLDDVGNPLGIPSSKLRWYEGLELKSLGKRFFFTGFLYQLSPYTEMITGLLSKFEETPLERLPQFISQFKLLNRLVASKRARDYYNGIVRKIFQILLKQGVEVAYDPRLDFYSGILLYEFGDEEGFAKHASVVSRALKEGGIQEIITIDPHTSYALKLYPEYVDFDIEVFNYLELLENLPKTQVERLTIHDPCYYARYLEISDRPRAILESMGAKIVEVKSSRKLTSCCGGLIESFSPKLTNAIAACRAEELRKTGCRIVTTCPICMLNFRKVHASPIDLAEILWRAFYARKRG
jgi:Fe-S oxidoreductase